MTVKHTFQSEKADGGDTSLVRPSNWNANHTVDSGPCLLGNTAVTASGVQNITLGTGLSFSGTILNSSGFGINIQSSPYSATGDGTTDDTAAIQAALTAGAGSVVLVPEPSVFYKVTGALTVPTGTTVLGLGSRPEIRLVRTTSSVVFNIVGKTDVTLDNLTIDGAKSTISYSIVVNIGAGCDNIHVQNCTIKNAKGQGILASAGATNIYIEDCTHLDGDYISIELNAVSNCFVRNNIFTNNAAFGIFATVGTYGGEFSQNYTEDSGLELIGIRYDCHDIKVIGNTAINCLDNGISVTGYNCTVTGNICHTNKGSGIHLYGSNNTAVGNVCYNNGQNQVNRAGIQIAGDAGGVATNNTVVGNVCFDNQTVPTQTWGISLGNNDYTVWSTGVSVSLNSYRYYLNNLYIAASAGTTGATPPTWTTGTQSDGGVNWTFITTTTTSFNATGNEVTANRCFGNSSQDFNNQATAGTNTVDNFGNLASYGYVSAGNVTSPNGEMHSKVAADGAVGNALVVQNAGTSANTATQILFCNSTSENVSSAAVRSTRLSGTAATLSFFSSTASALVEALRIQDDGRVNRLRGVIEKTRTVTSAGTVTMDASTDHYVMVNKTVGAATTVTLTASPSTGQLFTIKDAKGDANVNNITIDGNGKTIDGASSITITTAYGFKSTIYNGTEWNVVA